MFSLFRIPSLALGAAQISRRNLAWFAKALIALMLLHLATPVWAAQCSAKPPVQFVEVCTSRGIENIKVVPSSPEAPPAQEQQAGAPHCALCLPAQEPALLETHQGGAALPLFDLALAQPVIQTKAPPASRIWPAHLAHAPPAA